MGAQTQISSSPPSKCPSCWPRSKTTSPSTSGGTGQGNPYPVSCSLSTSKCHEGDVGHGALQDLEKSPAHQQSKEERAATGNPCRFRLSSKLVWFVTKMCYKMSQIIWIINFFQKHPEVVPLLTHDWNRTSANPLYQLQRVRHWADCVGGRGYFPRKDKGQGFQPVV